MRVARFIGLATACVWLIAFAIAWTSPITYLKAQSKVRLAPVSVSWVLDSLIDDVVLGYHDVCKNPVLFAWHGSFGGGPVYSAGSMALDTAEYTEIVLFRTDIIHERNQVALAKMAVFNDTTLSRCFTDDVG